MSSTFHSPMISLLTDDLLARILDNLPDPSDKKSFRAVCKAFHSIESCHRTRIRILRPEFLPSLLTNYPHIHTLDLSVCPSVDNATVSRLLHGVCGNIHVKKLILKKATGLRYSGLEIMMGFFSGLVAVDVSHCCEYGDREAAAISGAAGGGLREVRMDKCLKVTDVGLAKIAVRCGERLEKVSLKWCMEISDMGIDLLSNKCPHLKHLDISYLKVSNEALGSIGCLKKLEVLVMVSCGLVDDVGLHYLANGCPLLQRFEAEMYKNADLDCIMRRATR